jgi:uncharacterized protein (DUF849 family)
MLIQAAMNGGLQRDENPAIPVTPDELAASAKEAVDAGAGALHFHVRSQDGRESLAPDDVAAAVSAVRRAVPSTPFGVSTGAWILRDPKARYEAVSRWKVLPDFASVNMKEEGAVDLANLLLSLGIGIEAGFTDVRGTETFAESGLASRCLRILLEPLGQDPKSLLGTVEAIETALDHAQIKMPRLLHGVDRAAWDTIDLAIARGYDTRVGFEDVLNLPDGIQASSNAALVAEAARRIVQCQRAR